MTLVDTSVWIDFFRGTARATALAVLLEDNEVLLHPWVLGELVLGGLGPRRTEVIADMRRLPVAQRAQDEEVMELVERRNLSGRGIGWVDVHILASALVSHSRLWTFDHSLARAAKVLELSTAS